jgi:hypothetical protein
MDPQAVGSEPPPEPEPPAAYRNAAAWTLAIVVAFALLAAGAAWRGQRGRVFAKEDVVRTVDSPEQAFLLWKAAGLRGRTLLLFGSYPHFHTTYEAYARGALLGDSNWIEHGIFENVLRRIYWIVPDADWTALRKRQAMYSPIQPVPFIPGPTSLYTGSGVPLQAVTPSTLPPLGEPVLVFVDGDRFDPGEVAGLLARRSIRSDLLVVHRRRPPG